MPRFKASLLTLTLATLSAPIMHAQNAVSARPGTVNYIEGQASLEGQELSPKSVGHAELAKGQYLATANGKAELLLTPGVFLRLDYNSTVKMVTPDLTHTEVQLTSGRATVEVDQLYKQNDILVDLGSGQTQLLKNGLYEFDATANTVRVFNGEAAAFHSLTPEPNERAVKVKEGKQLAFADNAGKTVGFNRKDAENTDPLYKWSSLRSGYLGEANLNLASSYANDPRYGYGGRGYGGYGSGWLWSPSIYSYTWLPGDGLFFSPFGYGFYSAPYLFGGGLVYGGGYGYGGGGYGGGYGGAYGYRGWRPGEGPRPGTTTSARAGTTSSGFHGTAASGGGFHGGGGGGGAVGGGGSHGGGGGGHR